jgi:hypothetical protein
MNAGQTARRGSCTKSWRPQLTSRLTVLFLLLAGLLCQASAQPPNAVSLSASAELNTEEIVQKLVAMDLERSQALHAYQVSELYRLAYRGFLGTGAASMVVSVKYRSPGTTTLTIESSSGSKLILNKVFKKLLQAERQVIGVEAQRKAALNRNNYDFELTGQEKTPSGLAYVLRISPKRKDRFLCRGRIWVDTKDSAVIRLEGEPAKNPSFWAKTSEIERIYKKVGVFWLPSSNTSTTTVRFGGRANMVIQYNNYLITSAEPLRASEAGR